MKSYCHITYQSTRDSYALIIVSLKSPNKVLTKVIYIYSVTKAINESRESYQTVLCYSLEWLENKNEELNYIASGLSVELVPSFYQDNLQKSSKIVLILSSFLVAKSLQVRV
jgi:hypothetical protein